MIKLFKPESFIDYIKGIEGSVEGSLSSIIFDQNPPELSGSIHDFGLVEPTVNGSVSMLNGYFEQSLIDEINSTSDTSLDGEVDDTGTETVEGNVDDIPGSQTSGSEGTFEDDEGGADGEIIDPMDFRPDLFGNGDVILRPDTCEVSAELNGQWKLTMHHGYDAEGRYTYITKGSVIVLPVRITREQEDIEQAFRIFQVKESQSGVDVVAYPVIYESVYETPIDVLQLEEVTAEEFKNKIQVTVTGKFGIELLGSFGDEKESIYIENSNLQEVINGGQEGTFTSLYDAEVIYDNYVYKLSKKIGNPDTYKDYVLSYANNITGITVDESTEEMVTRIFPMSDEGVAVSKDYCVESANMTKYPFPYAKSIRYDDIKLVDLKDEKDETPETAMQAATREVKAAVTAKVNELSLKYLKQARAGQWDDTTVYQDYTIYNRHNPERGYSFVETRRKLPYGYLFYSYTDAIGVLTERVLTDLIENQEEKDLYADAIKDGFKWCESTEIAGYDWRMNVTYDDENYEFFQTYHWIQDEVGWYYGDGAGLGHYMRNAWIEESANKHYWVGDDGYWQPQWDDDQTWYWFQNGSQWWYGNKNPDGSTKNYAREQYIYVTENGNTYWFDSLGYFVDGDDKKWGYGTKDGTDVVTNQYWTVGKETWWFNENGEIDNTLAYVTRYDWREDDHGKYFGDGQGHWLSNQWVEVSDSKHRYIDQDGYYYGVDDESSLLGKYDGQQWTWHGNWQDGWWYGDNYEDDDEPTTGDETPSIPSLPTVGASLDPQYENINSIFDSSSDATQMPTSSIQKALSQGFFFTNGKTKLKKLKKKITNLVDLPSGLIDNLKGMGYKLNEDQTALELPDTDTSPSGEDPDPAPEHRTGLKNYVWGQYMYVSGYNKWYWFDSDGYYVDCWLATDNWEWHNDSVGWWYGDGAGTYPQGQWMKIGGKWYFFDERGYADPSTDDFEDPKNGSYESATYDSNREGIKASSSRSTDDEVVYDHNREGVRAWIQDGFVDELVVTIVEQSNYLHNVLKEELTKAAKEDLKEYDHPKYAVTVNFATLANSQNYAKFAFLKDLYLGDTVTIDYSVAGVVSMDRVTAIAIDCIKNDISSITIGNPTKTFIKNMANLTPKGTIRKWKPDSGLEDGYGGYLLTGFAGTNLSV